MKKLGTLILFVAVLVPVYMAVKMYVYQYQAIQEGKLLADQYQNPYVAGLIWQGSRSR